MTSDRQKRQVEALLDEAEAAIRAEEWPTVRQRVRSVLALDPENVDALAYSDAADRAEGGSESAGSAASPSPTPASSTEQPTSFANDRYTVTRFLGEGGKKRVYLAHDAQLDRDVAFALIKTEGLDEAARQRVTREAQAMGRLGSHPHIVTVYDIGEENGQPYLVLPVLPGGDVEGVIEDAPEHKLSIEQAVKIAMETCLGLEFSHSKGIIHRDLKPGNVWLAEDGRAMIGDFGLAVAVDRSRLTQAGMMVGTVNYMPPEQAMGGEISPRSDLYSLGAMLYEMVCGRPPFVGDESVAIIGQHLNTPPVAPTWHRPDCPPGLEALILRLLEKDQGKRPGSATEVREALEAVTTSPPQRSIHEEVTAPHDHDPLYRRVFVGRENELRQLQQAYDAAVSGQGGLVMVVGEPGIGKTTVCEQLATYASMRGGNLLVGHCYEEGSLSLPYLAFVEAMRSYVLDRDPDALRSELGSGAADVARIVSEVRDKVDVELPDTADPDNDRWRLLTSITTFLRNAASVQPLVIVLEDLHWSDRGTLDLLLHVARNLEGARLLIVGTYRDVEVDRQHPLSATLADLRRINTFLRVPLRGLTVDEVHRMYEAIRGFEVPWGQAELVHRQTEGNPLFVQEVLRYLVEEGIIVREGGQYVVRGDATAIPEGLRDVVGRRLSHLSAECNRLLAMAAVIGRDFRLDTLRTISGVEEDDLEAWVEEATRVGVLEERTRPGVISYRFTHAFFRQTLYEELSAPRRLRIHQDVARVLEDQYDGRLQEHAVELAEHFANSTDRNDLAKAIDYSQMAAARAMSVFDYGEAARLLEKALDAQEVLAPDDSSKRCDLLLALAGALYDLGEFGRVIDEVAPLALALAEKLEDHERGFKACQTAIWTLPPWQITPVVNFWVEAAERHARDDVSARILVNRRKANLITLEGHSVSGAELARQTAELALSHGGPDAEYTALQLVAEAGLSLEEVIPFAEALLDRSRVGVTPVRLMAGFGYMILTFWANGDREAVHKVMSELDVFAEQRRYSVAAAFSKACAWFLHAMDGILEVFPSTGAMWSNSFFTRFGSAVSFYKGLTQPDLQPDISLTGRLVNALSMAHAYNLEQLYESYPKLSDEVLALRHEASIDILADLLEVSLYLQEYNRMGEVLEELRTRQLTRSRMSPEALLRPPSRVMGEAAAVLNRPEEARALYEENTAICEEIGHRPELALTRLDLAELLLDHYPDEHDAAIQHLDFAITEFQDMKMQPALERALGRRGLLKA